MQNRIVYNQVIYCNLGMTFYREADGPTLLFFKMKVNVIMYAPKSMSIQFYYYFFFGNVLSKNTIYTANRISDNIL